MKPIIVGQAPSRLGDGTPFTGPSGDRICQLLGVRNIEQVKRWFDLANVIDEPLTGEDRVVKRRMASGARSILYHQPHQSSIIACGKLVWSAMGGAPGTNWYNFNIMTNGNKSMLLWLFPHPSGLSHYWNVPSNREIARCFLIAMAQQSIE